MILKESEIIMKMIGIKMVMKIGEYNGENNHNRENYTLSTNKETVKDCDINVDIESIELTPEELIVLAKETKSHIIETSKVCTPLKMSPGVINTGTSIRSPETGCTPLKWSDVVKPECSTSINDEGYSSDEPSLIIKTDKE